mmetsp:Transcript_27422/g.38564  ORF Transcript_27422/g.38564 Transcript_27422/m.38564 type:complete len:234 (-) Transcript_27422:801-1502(-)
MGYFVSGDTDNPRHGFTVKLAFVPMIARARVCPRGLIFQLRPRQGLTIKLVANDLLDFRCDNGSITLSIGGRKKLHGGVIRQREGPFLSIDTRHGAGRQGTCGTGLSRFGIVKVTVGITRHAQNMSRFVNGDIQIIRNNMLQCFLILFGILQDFDLIQTKVNGTGSRTIKLIKVTRHSDRQSIPRTESIRVRTTDIENQIGILHTCSKVFVGRCGKFRIPAKFTSSQFLGGYL